MWDHGDADGDEASHRVCQQRLGQSLSWAGDFIVSGRIRRFKNDLSVVREEGFRACQCERERELASLSLSLSLITRSPDRVWLGSPS